MESAETETPVQELFVGKTRIAGTLYVKSINGNVITLVQVGTEEEVSMTFESADKAIEVAKKLGFNSEGKMYVVCGGDTYAIKDQLKALGARFDYNFKWFLSNPVELPEGYQLCEFSFDELYDYAPLTKWANLKEGVSDIIKGRLQELKTATDTKYYPAEVKDKISVQATLAAVRGFDSMYGYTYIYTFTLDEYVFVWMTAKDLDIEVNTTVDLAGTIKGFEDYAGQKQTQVTRCKVSAVAAA